MINLFRDPEDKEFLELATTGRVSNGIKFFDAHTHAQFSAYDEDRDLVMTRAKEAGVGMVNVGSKKSTSVAAVDLAHKYENTWAAIGLHPIHASGSAHHDKQESMAWPEKQGEPFDYDFYKKLALNPKVVAIGECGLDYYRFTNEGLGFKNKQIEVFIRQIELSHEVKKPLMIHCRDAFDDLIKVLKANSSKLKSGAPGIVHFFTGSLDDAEKLLETGFYFTFGGTITYPFKVGAPDYQSLVKFIPLDRILSETDAPYVAPEPYRGKRNEPAYVVEAVKKLAEIKGVLIEEINGQILKNTEQVFNIKFSSF